MNVLEKVRYKGRQIRERGLWFVLRKFVHDRIVAHDRHVLLERDLALPHKTYSRRRDWTIRMLDSERDVDLFRTHFPDKLADVRKMFADGVIGSAVFVDDELVGYMWYATRHYYEKEYAHRVVLDDDAVYQFAGLLIPRYRGTLMVLDGMQYGHRYLHEAGYRRTTCFVDVDLKTNMSLHFKLGFRETGRLLHVYRLLFLRWSRIETYEGNRYFEPG